MTDISTISNWTTDKLLARTAGLNLLKQHGRIGSQQLTQAGLDRINEELSTIDAELDSRAPEGEFRTLYQEQEPVGFEPVFYTQADAAIEELSGFDQWDDYGFTIGSFL